MSRILDALKKAVPPPKSRPDNAPNSRPLIFEKISFTEPSAESIRREVEAKKESARLRYVLNEGAASAGMSAEARRLFWIVGVVAAGIIAVVIGFPKQAPSPQKARSESALELHGKIAALESELRDKEAELNQLRSVMEATSLSPDDAGTLESLRSEVRRLNRRLAVMLQDNLEKDQEIARLSGH